MHQRNEDGFEQLHPNARWAMRIGMAILALILTVIPLGTGTLLASASDLLPLSTLWLALPLVLLGQLLAWRFAAASYRRTRYRLDDHGLLIERGVFWRSVTRIPRSRVQHTDINRGPLDRRLGLAGLKVYTAGTRMAAVGLDGLAAERAQAMRDDLINAEVDAV